MKIVLATNAPDVGGVWTHLLDLEHGLKRAGHEVVLALQPNSVPAAAAASSGVPFVQFARINSVHADVVHFHMHNSFERSAISASVRRYARRSSAVVITEHLPQTPMSDSAMPRDPALIPGRKKPGARQVKTLLKSFHLSASDQVIAVSQSSSQFLATRYPLPRTPISVVHNGVEPARDVTPLPGGAVLRVGAVGVLAWRKGFDVLVEASHYATKPWTAHVYGLGDLRQELECRSIQTGNRVRFEGWTDEARTIARQFDVMCLPSRAEAFPYSVLEAMGQGRATVATRVNGVPELIDDRISGMLVEPGSPKQLAAALDLLADAGVETLSKMGEAARDRVSNHFTVAQMIEKTLDAYSRAVCTARRRGA